MVPKLGGDAEGGGRRAGRSLAAAIPDALSASRIVASVLLILTEPLSVTFFACYLWCGLSDVLDGILARRLEAVSSRGAALDSWADFVFIAAALFVLFPILPWQPWMLGWMGAIAVLRFVSSGVAYARFGAFAFLHTWANKAAGLVIFCAVPVLPLVGMEAVVVVSCAVASFSALEETMLMMRMGSLDRDVRSLLSLRG